MKTLTKLESIDDSLEILESTSGRPNLKEDLSAAELAKLLDGLPLALASSGAYLKGLTTSCAQYIDLYKQEWSDLHQRPQGLLSEDKTLFSIWNVSYEYIKVKDENAAKLLHLWSYFDNNDLWYELLKDDCIASHVPSMDKPEFWLTQRRLMAHADRYITVDGNNTHQDIDSDAPFWLGNLYADQGRLEKAETMNRRALEGKEKAWGPDHTSTLTTVNNLGILYADQRRLKEAEVMHQRALEGFEKAWAPDHPSTLDTVNNLGNLYVGQGRLKEAVAMYQRLLNSNETV
ncbi:hypothetical protein G3M48_009567 [Beauveria asiatica]|uniref:Uncharacterized protein n=1 Tax=Beauveria asiatica TaxID=1069075 RepID=A0AAW0S2K9_9HYPO